MGSFHVRGPVHYIGHIPTEQEALTTGLGRAGPERDLVGRVLGPGNLLDMGSEGAIQRTEGLPVLVVRPLHCILGTPLGPGSTLNLLINLDFTPSSFFPLLCTLTCFFMAPI